ncbi:MAG: thiamine phosphate synthase [Thermoplasmata archaeon]
MMTLRTIPRLYPIIDDTFVPLAMMEETTNVIVGGGAKILQLRAKNLSSGDFLDAAKIIREITKKSEVIFIVNDRLDVAILSDADGIHLGQRDMPACEARRLLGRSKVIGISTHNLKETFDAKILPIDYISFGPIWPTTTKGDAEAAQGLKMLSEVLKAVDIPIVAIGGITEARLSEVLNKGASSAAMISDIFSSNDIKEKVKRLIKKSEKGGTPLA